MNLFIRQVKIVDQASAFNDKCVDVLIEDGKYKEINESIKPENIPDGIKVVDGKGLFLSTGWFDMHANFREPGDEQKETIRSGQAAAAQGGFTGVLLMPSTKPPVQTRAAVEYILAKSANHVVNVYPSGCLTQNREGKDIAEYYDMQLGGAIAFTDDKRTITDSGVMVRILQYAGNLQAKVIVIADDPGLSGNGIANESANTTLLGFKGSPDFAEVIDLQRLCSIVEYTGQALHFTGISTKRGVEVIRQAKKLGLPVTAEVYVYHLLLSDEALDGFDTNFKVKPPLRSVEDRDALRLAVVDGTIDVISTDHSPENSETKDVEFDYAAFGMIGLESAFGVIRSALGKQATPQLISRVLSKNPRRIIGLPDLSVKVGELANLTLFTVEESWKFTENHIQSLSKNSPFIGNEFIGKVKGVYNNSEYLPAK